MVEPLRILSDKLIGKKSISINIFSDFIDTHRDQLLYITNFDNIDNDFNYNKIGIKRMIYDILLNIILRIEKTSDAKNLLEKLINVGFQPNICFPNEQPLIFFASLHYRTELLEVMLKNGINPNCPTRNYILENVDSPLDFILRYRGNISKNKEERLKTIKILLDYGTLINNKLLIELLQNEFIPNMTNNINENCVEFYLKYHKNITIPLDIARHILKISFPLSLKTICKFVLTNKLNLNIRNLIENRILPESIYY